jgi:hypothetical protein
MNTTDDDRPPHIGHPASAEAGEELFALTGKPARRGHRAAITTVELWELRTPARHGLLGELRNLQQQQPEGTP